MPSSRLALSLRRCSTCCSRSCLTRRPKSLHRVIDALELEEELGERLRLRLECRRDVDLFRLRATITFGL